MIQKFSISRRHRLFSPNLNVNYSPIHKRLGLVTGKVLRGLVLKTFKGGRVLISTGDKEFYALSKTGLEKGKWQYFLVEKIHPRIVLKTIDPPYQKQVPPLQLWASGASARRRIGQLLMDLSSLISKGGPGNDAKIALSSEITEFIQGLFYKQGMSGSGLKDALISSGLFLENATKKELSGERPRQKQWMDLKGLIVKLTQEHADSKNEQTNLIMSKASEILEVIRHVQLLNISMMTRGLGWMWVVPLADDESYGYAELLIKKTKKTTYLNIHTELEPLGTLDFGVYLYEDSISINIYVQDKDKLSLIMDELRQWKEELNFEGLNVEDICCEYKGGADPILSYLSGSGAETLHFVV